MSSIGAALGAAFVSAARAEASRRNGAKSRGPKTAAGKARSAQNALKHGLPAERFTVVGDEDEDAMTRTSGRCWPSSRPWAPCRPCSPSASRVPPGGSPGPTRSRPCCSTG